MSGGWKATPVWYGSTKRWARVFCACGDVMRRWSCVSCLCHAEASRSFGRCLRGQAAQHRNRLPEDEAVVRPAARCHGVSSRHLVIETSSPNSLVSAGLASDRATDVDRQFQPWLGRYCMITSELKTVALDDYYNTECASNTVPL